MYTAIKEIAEEKKLKKSQAFLAYTILRNETKRNETKRNQVR